MLAEARRKQIAAMTIEEQEELFQNVLTLSSATEEINIAMVLIGMVYDTGVVHPEQRRGLFHRLANWIIENNIGDDDSYLLQMKEDMEPRIYIWESSRQLIMEMPYVYKIVVCDYNRPKEDTGPDDPIFIVGINEAEDSEEYTLKELPRLKKFIQDNEHFDSLARNKYMEFIKEVENRYR